MCIAFACKTNLPSDRLLERGLAKNKDGNGIAWVEEHTPTKEEATRRKSSDPYPVVRWVKGLSFEDVKKEIRKLPLPVVIHFRNASANTAVIPQLCHPFPISQAVALLTDGYYSGPVVFHNGYWGTWRSEIKDFILRHKLQVPEGPFSDTRAAAFFAHHLGVGVLPMLDDRGRWAVLYPSRDIRYFGDWVHPENKGYNEDGFFMSIEVEAESFGSPHKSQYDKWQEEQKERETRGKVTLPLALPPGTGGHSGADPATTSHGTTRDSARSGWSGDRTSGSDPSVITHVFTEEELERIANEMAAAGRVGHA